ncbi:MAG: TetR/AcrR family transcriptional regulator [Spirochaetes bacterium]|uniref:TetR/AcrR family transcriptional regulator n=1 Tax=Candidatus Ornithospirochaeta stercoravium TaxID=2840897 RepID=A0A9D9IE53_9SPIO|nr:TetR/AcrR family transcriptional regulator [Candidatus Ornithospirochaeta stercoravium]
MSETERRILETAKKEFLERGFQGTSMRRIAALAGVTTGALYGYFDSKEKIFDSLVEDSYNAVMNAYKDAHVEFAALPYDTQVSGMGDITAKCVEWCLEYIYDHLDEFRLILMCSEGTRYTNMVDEMMKIEEESTEEFISLMRKNGMEIPEIDPLLEHMVTSGYFTSFFEVVRHSVPREDARIYIHNLQAFYKAGWERLFGMRL